MKSGKNFKISLEENSSELEGRAIIKEEQVEFLKSHAQKAGLWMESLVYSLLGFIEIDEKLFAVVRQPFVEGEQARFPHGRHHHRSTRLPIHATIL
jgi:hypothetical protein